MNKKWFRVAVLSLLVLAFSSEAFAQIRIRFARGRTSASVSGTTAGGGQRNYVVGARSGQSFTGNISSRSGCVKFLEGGTSLGFTTDGGDNFFSIKNYCRAGSTFTLTISIY